MLESLHQVFVLPLEVGEFVVCIGLANIIFRSSLEGRSLLSFSFFLVDRNSLLLRLLFLLNDLFLLPLFFFFFHSFLLLWIDQVIILVLKEDFKFGRT